MKLIEVEGNLFNTKQYTDEPVVLAHCIASDFGMYGGIATQFIRHFDMKNKLMHWSWRNTVNPTAIAGTIIRPSLVGKAVKIDNVYNLVTKYETGDYPTLKCLKRSLISISVMKHLFLHTN